MKIEVTKVERTVVVAALMAYGAPDGPIQQLAQRVADETADPADDGPEVRILRNKAGQPWGPVCVTQRNSL